MAIPTTKEEIELILSHLHDGCDDAKIHKGENCDVMMLADLIEKSAAVDAWLRIPSVMLLASLDWRYFVTMSICTGIKIGWLIQRPELLVIKDNNASNDVNEEKEKV